MRRLACIATLLLIGSARPGIAQSTAVTVLDTPPAPLLVLHVAALENVLSRLQQNLQEVDRDDVNEAFRQLLESRAGGLKGFDRSQPFGIALFLPETLPPRPVGVVYAPVNSFDDLIKTLELGRVTIKRHEHDADDNDEQRFTLTLDRGGTREIVVRDGYAFLSQNESYLDGDVASLAKLAPRLAAQYDIAAKVDLTTISPLLRDVFLGLLRSQAQVELQRRDDEPLPQFIVRKANGLSTLELIEHILRDGESLTLGLKMREESSNTMIEFNVEATPDSEFARYLADLAGHPSSYASLVNDREPMTFSASWKMSPREQRLGREWISSLAHGVTDRLTVDDPALADQPTTRPGAGKTAAEDFVPHPSVQAVVNSLNATVDDGHFDVCFQFRELGPGQFGLVGALHVIGGETLAGGLRELLTALQGRGAELEIVQDVAEHQGIAIHRVRGLEQRPQDRRIYGDDSALYVGASPKTLWVAVGSSRVLAELKSAVDRVAAAATAPASRQPPIQFLMQAEPWLGLSPEEGDDHENAVRRHELSEEAFDSGNDGLTIDVRPSENGARIRVELEAGFARMLTLMIAERYDRSRL